MDLANPQTTRPLLLGSRHMVSAGHPLAAMAGFRILEAGGNAIDAGVAAGFALNVVQPDMANLGGVAPIIMHLAGSNAVTTVSGVGRWPRLATREAVSAAGSGRIPVGPERWVVPAAVDAWLTALGRYGTLSAREVLAPAIELASRGFPANYFLSHNIATASAGWTAFAHNREVFLRDGAGPQPGNVVTQPALAETLRRLADAEGAAGGSRGDGIRAARDAFYKGDIAQAIDRFSREVGGFLRADDMERFSVTEAPSVSVAYRGRQVHACGPWSQGPAVPQMLAVASQFDLAPLADGERAHLLIEIVKRALADRNRHYGDPDFVDVPLDRLLSDAHAQGIARSIDMSRAGDVPDAAVTGRASPDTTYVCVTDTWGNGFSATPSDSTMLVTPMVPGLGFGLSDRGLQASLDPENPNCVAPGKRPRLTPNPGIVLGGGTMVVYGTPGGEIQTQAMLQFLVNHLDLGHDLQTAVEAPRWATYAVPATEDPHPATPRLVRVEDPLGKTIGSQLHRKGHAIEHWPRFAALAGGVCAIARSGATGVVSGAADPRRMSYAVGW